MVDPLSPTIGSEFMNGRPIEDDDGNSWDMAFELRTERPDPSVTPSPTSTETATPTRFPTPVPDLKWSQPPVRNPQSPEPNCFWGWDETSAFNGIPVEVGDGTGGATNVVRIAVPIVADDWLCKDQLPVTDVHWWGSYQGWNEDLPPGVAPDEFHIGIWTDRPAEIDRPWSHPEEMVWEMRVQRSDLREESVGCDFYPEKGKDQCFRYNLQIPRERWFHQNPEPATRVYWIIISAV